MESATIEQIEERLRLLPPENLGIVLQFVRSLGERPLEIGAWQTMLASEAVLGRDWDTPEEDTAWAHL